VSGSGRWGHVRFSDRDAALRASGAGSVEITGATVAITAPTAAEESAWIAEAEAARGRNSSQLAGGRDSDDAGGDGRKRKRV
jgi:hypothetical protein